MNSEKNGTKKLPDGWVQCTSKSNPGRKYFFNKKTGKSSWTQPQDNDKRAHPKHKSKKKCSNHEKNKKQELVKKNLKRKSDGKPESSPQLKKYKEEGPIPKVTTPSPRKPSPAKHGNSTSGTTPHSASKTDAPTPKNSANARLSHLREKLAAEVQKEDLAASMKSPTKLSRVMKSPNSAQAEPQAKTQKVELKSPTHNESKCLTNAQSPTSDSMHSTPSPSQFFAANKIISSMKAQLPEEYNNRLTNKNTFDVIEEGISKQTAEFPFMKHPATPPQFSEANKLVSAIKSKLSYKGSGQDTPVNNNRKSANDRLQALRTRLSSEATEENMLSRCTNVHKSIENNDECEAMDVDFKQIIQKSQIVQCTKDNTSPVSSKENLVLVVDTNIFIHELNTIMNVVNSHIRGYREQPILLVPWRVICELDRLKDNNNGNGAICKRARAAMDYLYKQLPESGRVRGQLLRDANSHIYPCEVPDDEILNCCMQQTERGYSVILLSNDKNLCNKAIVNNIKTMGLEQLKPLMELRPLPAYDSDLYASVKYCENAMYILLSNILENEMRAKYNNLWKHVVFKPPPWALADVLQGILKHWIAVFDEVFPRIKHLIIDLNKAFNAIMNKEPNLLTASEVSIFEELCLEVAKKCQIIPEYMELAKLTVDRLTRKNVSERPAASERDSDMVVIEAFEGLWTVFSSYCAKLCTGLGVPHMLEDKLQCNDPLSVLTNKYRVFADQIWELSDAIQGVLSIEGPAAEEHLCRLEAAFRSSLALVRADDDAIKTDTIRNFCIGAGNMLQEACTKFSQLTEILAACKYKIPND